jgi:hypothetical protein
MVAAQSSNLPVIRRLVRLACGIIESAASPSIRLGEAPPLGGAYGRSLGLSQIENDNEDEDEHNGNRENYGGSRIRRGSAGSPVRAEPHPTFTIFDR